jgi:hypothetical protein
VGQGSGGVIGQPHLPDPGPAGFSGTYSGALTGADTSANTYSGSFTIGIADLAGNAQVNSVNMNAICSAPCTTPGNSWSAASQPGFSAPVSLGGAFQFDASPALPNNMALTTVGDGLSVQGQTDGRDMNLAWQVDVTRTGTGHGTKQ